MSERSIYLRDQAAKCRRHAGAITDPYTRAELQKLAAEYIERATEIESKEDVCLSAMQPSSATHH